MQLLTEEESERVETMTDAELRAEMRRLGLDPDRPPPIAELLGRPAASHAAAAALDVPRPRARARWVVGLAAAAAMGVALGAVLGIPRAIWRVATTDAGAHPSEVQVRAEALRDQAEHACAELLWVTCRQRLDDAQKLDPQGESEARVARMRATLETAAPAPSRYAKPPIEHELPK
jgi:hypothetical protein